MNILTIILFSLFGWINSQAKEIPESDTSLDFARTEFRLYIPSSSNIAPQFRIDPTLKDGLFAYRIQRSGRQSTVTFLGETPIEVSHAVHEFLEQLGFHFGLDGVKHPKTLRPDTLRSGYYLTRPHTRWRGIRQHVNFPMDISSYPQEEAREYLRRLVRMRFNKIAVHSYPNLWHEVVTGDTIERAGNFFYDRPHPIPDHPLIRDRIRFNKKLFCIPEVESAYSDRILRSRQATAWMHDMLSYAKEIGLRVHFSIEPRRRGDIAYILDNARSAIEQYPMIDELGIITEELGGWGETCTDSTVRDVLVRRFGAESLQDTVVTRVIRPRQTDLDNLLEQLGRNMEAVRRIPQQSWFRDRHIELQLGIYCTIAEYAPVAYHLARIGLPDMNIGIMPGHGSVRTANHLARVRKNAEDLAHTTILSWIEFDGLMFSQQNPVDGIEALFRQLDTLRGGRQLNTVLFNHWRTAENAVAARYAAETSLLGPIDRSAFYSHQVQILGLKNKDEYLTVMHTLEKLDRICTNDLPNVGFCWIGAWLTGGPYTWMNRPLLQQTARAYDSLRNIVHRLTAELSDGYGRAQLSLLENRLLTSHLYLSAFEAACGIQDIKKDNGGAYPKSAQEQAGIMLDRSLRLYDRYMEAHGKAMPDRGCEGTLINLWHGPVYGVKVLRARIAGIPMDVPAQQTTATDAPPLPILLENK
jgi:hypothetical protein